MSPAGRSASRKWALKPIRSPGRPGMLRLRRQSSRVPRAVRGDDDRGADVSPLRRLCGSGPAQILITLSFQALDGPRLPHVYPGRCGIAQEDLVEMLAAQGSPPIVPARRWAREVGDESGRGSEEADLADFGPGQVPESIADADDVQQRQARRGEILAADFTGEPLLLQQDDRPAQACEQQGDRGDHFDQYCALDVRGKRWQTLILK